MLTENLPQFAKVGSRSIERFRIVAKRTIVQELEAVSAVDEHPAELAARLSPLVPKGYRLSFIEEPGVNVYEVVGRCEGCGAYELEDENGSTDEGWVSDQEGCRTCPKCYAAILEDERRKKVTAWIGEKAEDGDCENALCGGTQKTQSRRKVLLTKIKIEGSPSGNVEFQSEAGRLDVCDFCIDDGTFEVKRDA